MARRQRPFWPIERISASRSYRAGRGVNNRCAKLLRLVAAGSVTGVSLWLAGFQRYAWITAPAHGKITRPAATLCHEPGQARYAGLRMTCQAFTRLWFPVYPGPSYVRGDPLLRRITRLLCVFVAVVPPWPKEPACHE